MRASCINVVSGCMLTKFDWCSTESFVNMVTNGFTSGLIQQVDIMLGGTYYTNRFKRYGRRRMVRPNVSCCVINSLVLNVTLASNFINSVQHVS